YCPCYLYLQRAPRALHSFPTRRSSDLAPRPVRIELLGDTVESVREFDARTQRSIAPVVRTTLLPLTEWAVPAPENREAEGSLNRSEEHTSELQSRGHLVCRLLLEKKKK